MPKKGPDLTPEQQQQIMEFVTQVAMGRFMCEVVKRSVRGGRPVRITIMEDKTDES